MYLTPEQYLAALVLFGRKVRGWSLKRAASSCNLAPGVLRRIERAVVRKSALQAHVAQALHERFAIEFDDLLLGLDPHTRGAQLRKLRFAHGLSTRDVARYLDIDKSLVGQWERGVLSLPDEVLPSLEAYPNTPGRPPGLHAKPVPRRPRTRAECPPLRTDGSRPCPWVSCRYHLHLDLGGRSGATLFVNKALQDPAASPRPCALDLAVRGPWETPTNALLKSRKGGHMSLEEVGAVMGITRERVRQIEVGALRKLRAAAPELAVWLDRAFDDADDMRRAA